MSAALRRRNQTNHRMEDDGWGGFYLGNKHWVPPSYHLISPGFEDSPRRRMPNERTADAYASSSTRFTPPDCLDKSTSQGVIRESNGRMTNRDKEGGGEGVGVREIEVSVGFTVTLL